MDKTKQIPWVRMGAEGVAIIVSILIAFAIDAWWENRKERQEEFEILNGLQNEYAQHRALLESRVTSQTTALKQAGLFMQAYQSGQWAGDSESLDIALFWMAAAPTTDLGSGVRDALISGGRLSLLSNRTLRYQLATWDVVIEEVRDDEVMARDLLWDLVAPYFARHGIPIARSFSTHPDVAPAMNASGFPGRLRALADDPEAVSRLVNDPEFEVIVEYRFSYLAHMGTEYQKALVAVEEILTNIDADLTRFQ
ncbi:MAG TPA: hypothetical protein VJ984_02515 [Xanthomonadales bacterium]|nr:hypothetical protein [Xanthomonadales bacterium]